MVINGIKSNCEKVTSGVPQGSGVGPILFLLSVSDIFEVVRSDLILFADDTKLFRRVSTQEGREIRQSDHNKLQAWFDDWLM